MDRMDCDLLIKLVGVGPLFWLFYILFINCLVVVNRTTKMKSMGTAMKKLDIMSMKRRLET